MIKIVQSEKSYKPKIGDLVCEWFNEESPKYLVAEEGPGTDKIIPFACAHPNPWIVCQIFQIDTKPIVATYKCPYTGYGHYAIIPVALLVNGSTEPYKEIKFHSPDYLLDWEFHRNMFKDRRLELFDIPKLLLGSGYTSGTGHYDGHGEKIQRRVMLDNGDALWVYFWEWYNK